MALMSTVYVKEELGTSTRVSIGAEKKGNVHLAAQRARRHVQDEAIRGDLDIVRQGRNEHEPDVQIGMLVELGQRQP